jgi:hypothetical protein
VAAGAPARGVRLRGLIVGATDLIAISVERGVDARGPSVAIERGPDRAATVTLGGDVPVSRNGRRSRPERLRAGDRIAIGPDAVTATDPWRAQGTSTILPRVWRRSSSR